MMTIKQWTSRINNAVTSIVAGGAGLVVVEQADRVGAATATPHHVSSTASDTPTPPCLGDCSGNRIVTVDELVKGVTIALGTSPVSDCPPFDGNQSATVTVDELVLGVTNALNGCPVPGATTPPTPTRTPTPGGRAGDTAAGEAVIVANVASSVSSVVNVILAAVQYGGPSAGLAGSFGGAAASCPLGGSATRTGSFPGSMRAELNDCTVATNAGMVGFTGAVNQVGNAFSINASARFRSTSGVEVLTTAMEMSGNAVFTVSTGRCRIQSALLTVQEGTLRATVPSHPAVGMTFSGTEISMSLLSYNNFVDCVLLAHTLRLTGPAALLTPAGRTEPITFNALEARINATAGTITSEFISGGVSSACLGGSVTLASDVPLGIPSGGVCPSEGVLTFMPGAARATYREDMTVAIDSNGDGIPDVTLPSCLDPRLLECAR